MSQVQLLYHLQEIDSEIDAKKKRLGEVIRAQKETAELLQARDQVTTAVAELTTWQTTRNNLNHELERLSQEIKSADNRLYSGNVKNPKELNDLQHKIESLGRRRSALEDEILEAMIMIEDAQTAKTAAETHLTAVTTQWESSQTHLKQEQQELALRLHHLTQSRQQQTQTVQDSLLTTYETLRQRLGGTAVVRLKVNRCDGCKLTVSAQTLKDAREGKVVYCASCGRILAPFG